ncbi:MAG: late competence development ComFB family protein, partial [Oscillospiraceae bacterium]
NQPVVYNLTERMVIDRLDIALKKMECCRCDRCKNDILSLTMNMLPPRYSVCTRTEFEETIKNDTENGLETTSAILKAILKVRKNPHH